MTEKDKAEMILAETEGSYDIEDVTLEEVTLLKKLVSDRIENRFHKAMEAAERMDLRLLKGCTDELQSLETLKAKMVFEEAAHA